MKKLRKYSSLLAICLFCIGTSASCKNDETKTQETPVIETEAAQTKTPETAEIPEITEAPHSTADKDKEAEATVIPQETKKVVTTTVPIYSMNNETLEIEGILAELQEDQQVNAEFIVKEVVKSFADRGVEIGIYDITEREDGVCVSFEKEKAPIVDVGSSVEMAILDSISQSLLDNLAACQKVYFQVEDGPYESGHNAFEEDEPYTWK